MSASDITFHRVSTEAHLAISLFICSSDESCDITFTTVLLQFYYCILIVCCIENNILDSLHL